MAPRLIGRVGALWGLVGVALLLGSALWRLVPYAVELGAFALTPLHWIAVVLWTLFMAWTEGYKGFHLGFSPRVAARARYLREHPRIVHVLLAPLFCFGYFHATRRRQITSIAVSLGIVLIVIGVKQLAQPWRGIVDVGVVVGLSMGIVSLFVHGARALTAQHYPHDPQVPGP